MELLSAHRFKLRTDIGPAVLPIESAFVDEFLNKHSTGQIVDTQNPFTIDRRRAAQKTVDSIPQASVETICRLLDSAAWQLKKSLPETVKIMLLLGAKSELSFYLRRAETTLFAELLQELRHPFGSLSPAASIAHALYLATGIGSTVSILWSPSERTLLTLKPGQLQIPGELREPNKPNTMRISISLDGYKHDDFIKYRTSLCRTVFALLDRSHHILPLESLTKLVSGYFDYRTKPFTAIRSYAAVPKEVVEGQSLKFHLWDGLYKQSGDQTLLLNRKEPGKFFFLRWRPDYGRPTFLHHSLDGPIEFGKQSYRATFWVETSDRPAHVYIFSNDLVSDPILVKGPLGLQGLVVWPKLKYDLWGTRLVEDQEYEKALEWIQLRVDQTSQVLKQHLSEVLEMVRESHLLKGPYRDETAEKMQLLWG